MDHSARVREGGAVDSVRHWSLPLSFPVSYPGGRTSRPNPANAPLRQPHPSNGNPTNHSRRHGTA